MDCFDWVGSGRKRKEVGVKMGVKMGKDGQRRRAPHMKSPPTSSTASSPPACPKAFKINSLPFQRSSIAHHDSFFLTLTLTLPLLSTDYLGLITIPTWDPSIISVITMPSANGNKCM